MFINLRYMWQILNNYKIKGQTDKCFWRVNTHSRLLAIVNNEEEKVRHKGRGGNLKKETKKMILYRFVFSLYFFLVVLFDICPFLQFILFIINK